jgi:hypothetical protein
MKSLLKILPVVLLSLVFNATYLSAADLSLGVTSWYAMWDEKIKSPEGTEDPKTKSTLMAGPVLGFRFFENWRLGAQFYIGKMEMKNPTIDYDVSSVMFVDRDEKYLRFDSDITLGYQWFPWLNTYAGYKYFGYNTDKSKVYYENGATCTEYRKVKLKNAFMVLVRRKYLFRSLRQPLLFIERQWHENQGRMKSEDEEYNGSGVYQGTETSKNNINGWGANLTTALSYYISSASTTISLGYRYQYLKTKIKFPSDSGIGEDTITIKDKFHGVTLAAIYNIPGIW